MQIGATTKGHSSVCTISFVAGGVAISLLVITTRSGSNGSTHTKIVRANVWCHNDFHHSSYIPYSRKIWRGINFGSLAVCFTTAKLKSVNILYLVGIKFGGWAPNRHCKNIGGFVSCSKLWNCTCLVNNWHGGWLLSLLAHTSPPAEAHSAGRSAFKALFWLSSFYLPDWSILNLTHTFSVSTILRHQYSYNTVKSG